MSDGYQTCGPEPEDFTPLDACVIFAGLHSAYLALMTGQTRTLVKIGDRETRYKSGDLPALEKGLYRYAALAMRTNPRCARQVGADVWLSQPRSGTMRFRASTTPNIPFNYIPVRPFR